MPGPTNRYTFPKRVTIAIFLDAMNLIFDSKIL